MTDLTKQRDEAAEKYANDYIPQPQFGLTAKFDFKSGWDACQAAMSARVEELERDNSCLYKRLVEENIIHFCHPVEPSASDSAGKE